MVDIKKKCLLLLFRDELYMSTANLGYKFSREELISFLNSLEDTVSFELKEDNFGIKANGIRFCFELDGAFCTLYKVSVRDVNTDSMIPDDWAYEMFLNEIEKEAE